MALSILLAALAAAAQPPAAPPQACQDALGSIFDEDREAALPDPVDGATLRGREALTALRAARGDALVTIRGGDFSGADLRGARLHNICFVETNFAGSDWREAQADGVGFVRANLAGANFSRARMARVHFRQSDLQALDANGAHFAGGKLDGGWDGSVEGLRLDSANLRGFRFDCGITIGDGCPLDGSIDVSGADLTDASLNSYDRIERWAGAQIDRTEVSLTQLGALGEANVVGPIRVRGGDAVAELSGAELRRLAPHLGHAGEAATPSFDCARARADGAELLICGEQGGRLRRLDRDLAWLYGRARARGLAGDQGAWLAVRNRCAAEQEGGALPCIERAYEVRKQALVARLGRPDGLRPGETTYYVAPPVAVDEAFRADPLYPRLVPVMIGASWSRLAVRANRDGTIDAAGDAIGANAHSCTLGGERLRFDPATGWYGGPQEPAEDTPAEWRDRPMPVLLLWGDHAEVYQHGRSGFGAEEGDPRMSDYASCGARAGFSEMVRMPVSDAEAARLFETMHEP